jgi:hypothetical protein
MPQTVIRVSLYRTEFTGQYDEHGVERIKRIYVRDEHYAGTDRRSAERAWYRSEAYRNHGTLDWEIT